jgi:hypothetical protein
MLLFDGVCKYLKEWSKWRVNWVPQEEECDGGQYFNKVPLPAGHDVMCGWAHVTVGGRRSSNASPARLDTRPKAASLRAVHSAPLVRSRIRLPQHLAASSNA